MLLQCTECEVLAICDYFLKPSLLNVCHVLLYIDHLMCAPLGLFRSQTFSVTEDTTIRPSTRWPGFTPPVHCR